MVKSHLFFLLLLLILGGCASWDKDEMKSYREAFAAADYMKASKLLNKSSLKKDKKSVLLWHLEKGTVDLSQGDEDGAIKHFQQALEEIDRLYTISISQEVKSILLNDNGNVFEGERYERSYAHYFLARSYYSRYLKSGNKLDLQGARAAILAWDTFFTEFQRSSGSRGSLYSTDLMLKVFGAQIHEVSNIRSDKQISLQLYKDAHQILNTQGGIFSIFNEKNVEYIDAYRKNKKADYNLYVKTPLYEDLNDFLHYKILALTKEARGYEFEKTAKSLNAKKDIVNKASKGTGNVILVFEEGFVPQKVPKVFNFGIKGAMNAVDDPKAKAFIKTVGTEAITAFAMNKLGMDPTSTSDTGGFIFAHNVTKLAVQEAAVQFELPVIENVPPLKRLQLFILDDKGKVLESNPIPVITENGNIARMVLEEDAVYRYAKVGTRVAIKHIVAIVSAMQLYRTLNKAGDNDFFAKTAALAAYVGASKGIAASEQADTRHWTTLPHSVRISELHLKPGSYQLAIAPYSGEKVPDAPTNVLGDFTVKKSGKSIFNFRF